MQKARCKLCKTVIEMKKDVNCSCGEIGTDKEGRIYFRDINNFIPLDDMGSEIMLNVVEEPARKEPTFEELLAELNILLKNVEGLPPQAMSASINHYDFYNAIILIASLFRRYKP